MYVPEIIEVKESLEKMKDKGDIANWELPYENLLTRRSAAIFFVDLPKGVDETDNNVWKGLSKYDDFSFRSNTEKTLSELKFRITFSKEEYEKNSGSNGSEKLELEKEKEERKVTKKKNPVKRKNTVQKSETKSKKTASKSKVSQKTKMVNTD